MSAWASVRRALLAPVVFVPLLALLLVGLYAAFGFWGVPRLIHSQAGKYVREELHQELQLGEVRFNPFTFELELRDAAILEKGRPLVGFRRLFANYQVSSFFSRMHKLREVAFEQPYARAIIRPDGSLNLADLLPESDPNEPIPSVLIEDLAIRNGKVDFADLSRKLEPTKTLAPITFHLRDFQTTEEGGDLRLDTRTEDGEGLAWQGDLGLAPLASKGRFAVKGLKAGTVHEFLSEELPMALTGGSFDLAGTYTFAVKGKEGMQLEAVLPTITSKGLRLRARGIDEDWIQVPEATLEATRMSLQRHELTVGALRVQGLQAQVWLQPDGYLNVRSLFVPPQAKAEPAAAGPEWTVRVARIGLERGKVALEDRTVRPAAQFALEPVAATVDDFSLDFAKPVPITLTATVNGRAPLRLSGTVALDPRVADVQLEISKLPMQDVFAYLPKYPSLKLRSGEVSAKGRVGLRPAPGPELSYDGDASIDRFDLVEVPSGREFLSWDRVELSQIAYAAAPDKIEVRRILLRKPVARVVIAPNGKLNLASTLAAPTPTPVTQPAAANAASASELPPLKVGEVVFDAGVLGFADYSILPNFHARIDALRGSIRRISTQPHTVSDIDLSGHVINKYSPVTIKGRAVLLAYDERTDVAMAFRNIELPVFNPYSGKYAGYAIAKGKLTTELEYKIDHRRLVADHHVVIDQLVWGQGTDSKQKVSLPIRLATSLLKDSNGVIDLKLPVTGSLDDPKFRIGLIIWQIIKNIIVKIVSAPFRFLGSLFKGAEDAQYVDFSPGSAELSDKARSALPELAKSLSDRPDLKIDIPAGEVTQADVAALDDQRFQAAVARIREGKRGSATAYADLDDEDRIDVLKDLYRQEFGHRPDLPDSAEAVAEAAAPAPMAAGDASASVDPPTTTPADAVADAPAPDEPLAADQPAGNDIATDEPLAADAAPGAPPGVPVAGEGVAAPALATDPAEPPKPEVSAAAPAKEMTRRERKASRRQAQVAWLEGQLRPRFKADPSAGKSLAQARATAIQDTLLAGGALDPARVFLAGNLAPVVKDDVVRLELALK
ncbi:DUF748 domain-containing protein [Lysobacter niabensis]|uniref:DUF748 domain-containing protein n=1 Tax=Agrilutibacter niabensis TaxID=380628 RepID=UPI0036116DA0